MAFAFSSRFSASVAAEGWSFVFDGSGFDVALAASGFADVDVALEVISIRRADVGSIVRLRR